MLKETRIISNLACLKVRKKIPNLVIEHATDAHKEEAIQNIQWLSQYAKSSFIIIHTAPVEKNRVLFVPRELRQPILFAAAPNC